MPSTLTYPGVYIEELPSGVHTIIGASTSEAAFVDVFTRGPANKAVRVTSFDDFERVFGGLNRRSEASYAIMQYFLNGGSIAWVVRAVSSGALATATLDDTESKPTLTLTAADTDATCGEAGNRIQYATFPDHKQLHAFNMALRQLDDDGEVVSESVQVYTGLTKDTLPTSKLVTFQALNSRTLPKNTSTNLITTETAGDTNTPGFCNLTGGVDGIPAVTGSLTLLDASTSNKVPSLKVTAKSVGTWGHNLQAGVDYEGIETQEANLFNLVIREVATSQSGQKRVVSSEVYKRLSLTTEALANASDASALINLSKLGTKRPDATKTSNYPNVTDPNQIADANSKAFKSLDGKDTDGNQVDPPPSDGNMPPNGNGSPQPDSEWATEGANALKAGLEALKKTSFNILCLPAASALAHQPGGSPSSMQTVVTQAVTLCKDQRAFFIIDVPDGVDLNGDNPAQEVSDFITSNLSARSD